MVRTAGLLFGLPAVVVALVAACFVGQLSPLGAVLGILAIVCFAVIAIGWTEDHDVPD